MESAKDEMRLVIPEGCDNAPRKQILIEFKRASLQQDIELIEKFAHESIIWNLLQDKKKIEGLDAFTAMVRNKSTVKVTTLEIDQVITHGKFASINGVISFVDGTKVDFCDVYTFSSAAKTGKVKEIKSYIIQS